MKKNLFSLVLFLLLGLIIFQAITGIYLIRVFMGKGFASSRMDQLSRQVHLFYIKNRKMDQQSFLLKMQEGFFPEFSLISRDYKLLNSIDEYAIKLCPEQYEEARKKGWAAFEVSQGQNDLFLGIYYLKEYQKFLVFPIPMHHADYMETMIILLLITATLFLIVIGGITWYIIYHKILYRDFHRIREQLELLEDNIYDDFGDGISLKEFQLLEQEIHKLRLSFIELINKMQYKEKMAFLGELNAKMSHQIRNSLNGIQIAFSLIKSEIHNEKLQRIAKVIESEINTLQYTSQNLLNQVRPFKVQPIRTDMTDWLKKVQEKYTQKITFLSDFPDFPVEAAIDQKAMVQVMDNLFNNAIEASSEKAEVKLTIKNNAKGIILKIEDHGPGFTEEVLDARLPVTTKEQGHGLGLFFCRKVIEAHQGTFMIRNSFTNHAEVVIFIPSGTTEK